MAYPYDELSATQRQYPLVGSLADLLTASTAPDRTPQARMMAEFFGLPSMATTLDRISYGEPLTTGANQTLQMKPETAESLINMLGMGVPAGRPTAVLAKETSAALKPLVGEALESAADMTRMYAAPPARQGVSKSVSPARQQEISGSQGGLLEADYRGSHAAPNAESYGGTLDDLGKIMPADVYSSKGIRLYGLGDGQVDAEWFKAAYKAKGNPDAEVEVYRAVPKGVKDINNGDWVTTSKTYANQHGERSLDGDYEIIKRKVKANTLSSEGYPYEFGYNEPKSPSGATEFQAPQTEALKVAQSNAALPVEQGGLGLPANNTPMDRAKAMEWDVGTDYIHVGNEPINAINNTGRFPGIFSLQNDSAENYGKISSPFMLRGKVAIDDDLQNYTLKDLKYATGSTGKKAKEELNYAIRDEIPPDSEDIAEAVERMQNIRMRLAKSMGHPAVKMADEFSNTVALLPGSSVRSRFAAFDPMRRDEPSLMAGAIPFTPFLATDEEQRNSLMQSLGMN